MCGIAGLLRFDGRPVDEGQIERLTRALDHRGPDDRGNFSDGSVGLVHTRLAVIDPGGGAQPLFSEDRQVALTYNGELYNFAELRTELAALGHPFRTACDTEVVLRSWIEWGEECVQHFRGMFAFGVVDWRRQRLFLARDHFGIKPLVYFRRESEIAFASELSALRELPQCPREFDHAALDDYLALSHIPAPRTIFRDVYKLPPAHSLMIHFDGRVEEPRRYWEIDFRTKSTRREADWQAELEETLRASVRAHLVSDVPLGALLSGGVDSSLLVSLIAQERQEPLETFAAGFRGSELDESSHARTVSDRWHTKHRETWLESGMLGRLPELVGRFGEPFGDWSALPYFELAAQVRTHVPVVLAGDGADEAFGGYARHANHYRSRLRRIREFLRPGDRSRRHDRSGWEQDAMMVLRSDARASLWRPELRPESSDESRPGRAAARRADGLEDLDRARYFDYQHLLPDGILTKVDIASMAHGLEVRTPFIDLEVVKLAASLPTKSLHSRERGGVRLGKRPLRVLLKRWFPAGFVDRPKQGFVPPVAEWLRSPHPFRAELEAILTSRDARVGRYFEPRAIAGLIRDFDRDGFAEPLWLLAVLEHWLAELQ